MEDFIPSGQTLTLIFIGIIVLLVIVIWSIRRHNDPELHVECKVPINELMHSLAGLTLSTVVEGNSVRLLENGAFFEVVLQRIRAAEKTVHFETFLWKEGVLGQRMADALTERARSGIKVRVMLDATGSKKAGKPAVKQMRDAGCRVHFFHKRALRHVGVFNDRDHRKLLVIDGREAFVGGHCIVDKWLGEAQDKDHYSDISVHLHGPIVADVQAAFSENWAGETGELFVGDEVFPTLEKAGDVAMHLAYAKPEGSAPAVKILHHTAICMARKQIRIQNPYFIPESEALEAFADAVKRGVDVRVLMPSTGGSDNPMVQHAGHSNFETLLKAGVRLYEYPHTLLHQKVMTIDGVWSTVGSSNFDSRSFETNDEINVGICDEKTAQHLDAIFEKFAARSEEIKLEKWKKRGLWHRLKDRGFHLASELL